MNNQLRRHMFLFFNMIVPVLLGAIIYYFTSPDVIFVKLLDSILGYHLHINIDVTQSVFMRIIRNYFLDFLWAYSLIFVLFFVFGKNTAELKAILFIALIFSAGIELFQYFSVVNGTYDILDIIVEFFAEGIAVLIIKFYYGRKLEYEKQN